MCYCFFVVTKRWKRDASYEFITQNNDCVNQNSISLPKTQVKPLILLQVFFQLGYHHAQMVVPVAKTDLKILHYADQLR